MLKTKTRKLALAAILSALGVILLYFGSIITVLDLTMVAIASLIIYFAVIELGSFYPYLIYAVTAILSLLLLPDKFAGAVYLLFGGIYPILKEFFERLHYIVSWILKFSVFNTALLLLIAVSVYVMHVEDTGLGFNWVVFGLGNLTFLLYDIAMTKLISLYLVKLRRLFGFKDYFGTK